MFTDDVLPPVPIYEGRPGSGMVVNKVIIEPNKSHTFPPLFFPHRQIRDITDVKAILDHQKEFHAYGYICYGDLFGNPLKRLKFCETALNIFEGHPFIQWVDFGFHDYTGTDLFPISKTREGSRSAYKRTEIESDKPI